MKPIPPKPPDPYPSPEKDPDKSLESPIMFSPIPDNTPSRKRALAPSEDTPTQSKKITILPSETPPSIQSIYNHASLDPENRKYSNVDIGPYIVHVSRKEPTPDAGLTINRIKFGQFLVHSNIRKIVLGGVKMVGRNKVSVEFSSADDANNFLTHPSLSTLNYLALIPTFQISRMGVIREVPVDITMEELVANVILPSNCGIILRARRFNRKSYINNSPVWTPTQSVVLTFRGQVLPEKVYYCHSSLPVTPYIFPSIQCQKCCRFGHIKAQCRSEPRCYRCSLNHLGEMCDIRMEEAKCILCGGTHMANNRSCPEQIRQKSIKTSMAQNNISYNEASSQFPIKSFADVTKTPNVPANTLNQPNQSYKKTVFLQKKPYKPHSSKGYDKETHNTIVGSYDPPSPQNGCGLNKKIESSSIESIIQLLTSLLLNLISKNNLPNNITYKVHEILNLIQNAPDTTYSMEHQ